MALSGLKAELEQSLGFLLLGSVSPLYHLSNHKGLVFVFL